MSQKLPIRLTFEELSRICPEVYIAGEGFATDFWERLYQCFKERLIAEQSSKESDNGN